MKVGKNSLSQSGINDLVHQNNDMSVTNWYNPVDLQLSQNGSNLTQNAIQN